MVLLCSLVNTGKKMSSSVKVGCGSSLDGVGSRSDYDRALILKRDASRMLMTTLDFP